MKESQKGLNPWQTREKKSLVLQACNTQAKVQVVSYMSCIQLATLVGGLSFSTKLIPKH